MAKLDWTRARVFKGGHEMIERPGKDSYHDKWKHEKPKKEPLTIKVNGAQYIYDSRRSGKAVHIKSDTGTLCKVENQGAHVFNKLDALAPTVPNGRKLCAMCSSILSSLK